MEIIEKRCKALNLSIFQEIEGLVTSSSKKILTK